MGAVSLSSVITDTETLAALTARAVVGWWHTLTLANRDGGLAYNIRVTLPPLLVVPYDNRVTGEHVTSLYVPKSIAVLAPGQEWRTAWESAVELAEHKPELQSQFVGDVQFDDKMNPDKPSYRNPISLDTKMFWDTIRIETKKAGRLRRHFMTSQGRSRAIGDNMTVFGSTRCPVTMNGNTTNN
jgi:hypothetical protein